MNKCQDILKIVRGNGFTLCLQVEARRTDGTAVEDFALQGDEVLTLLHNGTAETKAYETVGNNVFVTFDGTDALGWYGLEMAGVYADEPWRWSVPKVFQIVETNERANLPSWTFLADDTYIIGCGITLLTSVCQADWEETNTSAPSYIKNKPDLSLFYQKPTGGIPASDLSSAVQTSLGKADNAQPKLTAGTGITIDGNNVISATASGGGVTEIEVIMPIVFGTYNESTGAYDNTYLKEYSSSGASWLYDIAPHIHQEMWSGSSEETTFRIHIGIIQGPTNVYGSVLAYIISTGSHELTVSFSFEGVNYVVLFDVSANHATTTAYKLSHLVANEENKFYLVDLSVNDLIANPLASTTIAKLSAMRLDPKSPGKLILFHAATGATGSDNTLVPATITKNGSNFEMYLYFDGRNIHVTADSTNTTWEVTQTTLYVKPSNGIPSTDLSSAVQTSLGKADTALQAEDVGIVYHDDDSPYVSLDIAGDETDIIMTQQPSGPEYHKAPSWRGAEDVFEQIFHKVTSVSASSTDSQYPSAKCVYDLVGDVASLLAAI